MSMQNPAEFWGDEMGTNSNSEVVRLPPYIKNEKFVDKNGEFMFDIIGRLICRVHSKEFLPGCLDLDYWWQHSEDPQIVRYRKHETFSKFETPYGGRMAYMVKIFVEKEKTSEDKKLNAEDKGRRRSGKLNAGDLKRTQYGWYLYGYTNIFHNVNLGWKEGDQQAKTKKKMVNGLLRDVEIEGTKNQFFYKRMSYYPTTACGERMEKAFAPYIKLEGGVIWVLLLGNVTRGKDFLGKPSYQMNVDDFFLMVK